MIDFRYHLVSLISVFLALAVGVVLGAGPLQNSLGTALNDQVTSLRADRNATQTQLEQTEAAVNDRDAYISAAADTILPGTLTGKNVALAVLPNADTSDVDDITKRIEAAGGMVSARVTLTSAWSDASRETFRSTYSGQFTGYLKDTSSLDGNGILGEGLATALTTEGADAQALLDLLTASDTPLISVDAKPTAAANAVVVVGPRSESTTDATASPTPADDSAAWVSALTGSAAVAPTVVVGAANQSGELVSALRSAKATVTTVDSVGQTTASVSMPLALAATISGTVGAYGFDDGADSVMPPVAG